MVVLNFSHPDSLLDNMDFLFKSEDLSLLLVTDLLLLLVGVDHELGVAVVGHLHGGDGLFGRVFRHEQSV